jgi:hypothetical protein
MITKKAYYRYEKKGGTGDDPVEDWLAAKTEIEKNLKVFWIHPGEAYLNISNKLEI